MVSCLITRTLLKLSIFLSIVLIGLLLLPKEISAQDTLQRMSVTPTSSEARGTVFRNYPDKAGVIFESAITNLRFSSNMDGIVEVNSQPQQGRYVLIIDPFTQIISIEAPGFVQERIRIGSPSPRDVLYYSVERASQMITETGTLLLRSDPSGANVSVLGIPGEFETPVSFDDLLAQTYTIRLEMKDYRTEEIEVTIDPSTPNIRDVELTPTFGYVTVQSENAQLYISPESMSEEYRISYTPNQARQLDVGNYTFRLTREYYRDATGSFEITPAENSTINVNLEPDFATLQVTTNVNNFTLSSPDNNAPASNSRDRIYLERGQRQVIVDANGYAPIELDIFAEAGARYDTTLTLISEAELAEQQRREQLPRGILNLTSDVDADIYINGENQGTGSVQLSLTPDTYQVEMRHELGRKTFDVTVPSADIVEQHIRFLPSKQRSITRSALLPGMGHVYTKRPRGYIYLALAGAAAGYAVYNYLDYRSLNKNHDQAIENYQNAGSVQEADRYRNEIQQIHTDRVSAHENLWIGLGVFGAVYLLQLADITVTSPQFGYSTEKGNEFNVGLISGRIGFEFRF